MSDGGAVRGDIWLGLAVGVVAAVFVGLAFTAAYFAWRQAKASKREARQIRADILTIERSMVTILRMVATLDPQGRVGVEASALESKVRSMERRLRLVQDGSDPEEAGAKKEPAAPTVHEPLDEETRWALDCEANGWCDANGVPLSGADELDAKRAAAAFHKKEQGP
jgi:hypothetical protein